MARAAGASYVGGRRGVVDAARTGLVAGIVAALLAAGGIALWRRAVGPLPFERPRDISNVLIVIALPDEQGAVVAQAIAEVDAKRGAIASVDPSMPVTIPGTSYGALKDAYPFLGGGGVARILADVRGGKALPWLAIEKSAADEAMAAQSGLQVELPEPMAVFDGERLYDFPEGRVRLSNVGELRALLNGASYMAESNRRMVLQQVASAVTRWVASYPGGPGRALETGRIESDLTPEEVDALADGLKDRL